MQIDYPPKPPPDGLCAKRKDVKIQPILPSCRAMRSRKEFSGEPLPSGNLQGLLTDMLRTGGEVGQKRPQCLVTRAKLRVSPELGEAISRYLAIASLVSRRAPSDWVPEGDQGVGSRSQSGLDRPLEPPIGDQRGM
jgi:hypothetical protein